MTRLEGLCLDNNLITDLLPLRSDRAAAALSAE